MRHAAIATALLFPITLAGGSFADAAPAPPSVPQAVKVARTTVIPRCTSFVDVAAPAGGTGTAARPFKTIALAAGRARAGAIICVAQGIYRESIRPGTKPFTLAGGFQRSKGFKVRDSAAFVSKAQGSGGSFLRIEDPAPTGTQLSAVDGFEITGYSQAVVRAFYVSQRFDLTNNNIHDNACTEDGLAGSAFALENVSGTIRGNVLRDNSCGRGGGGALYDGLGENTVTILNNVVDGNSGTEPGSSHGGGLYLFSDRLTVTGNLFINNTVTAWGGGLYVGAFAEGGLRTKAKISWNRYRNNRAGIFGGGFFCDDSASCTSDHEIFDRNCGGNVYYDSGFSEPTIGKMDHMTNVNARSVGCGAPGPGVLIDRGSTAPDTYSFTNSIFSGNQANADFGASCGTGCSNLKITVAYSMVQRRFQTNGAAKITFGAGIVTPVNPQFVNAATGDFHLKSRFGHFTSRGYVRDTVSSPALAKGDPRSPVNNQPPRAGRRSELGAYGNSNEASYVR